MKTTSFNNVESYIYLPEYRCIRMCKVQRIKIKGERKVTNININQN